ncbi:MAG: hypothetical protein J0M04_09180 [Verrucomicrobia bacterium]|nr:hypothetical protein [Verrucomicrobiota bacterium]
MKTFTFALLAITMVPGRSTADTPFELDAAKQLLEARVGGTWGEEPTSPDIGPMLRPKTLPAPLTAGFFGVFPFGQDELGKKKVDLYVSTCSAPLYVLGFNDRCTVITWLPRDNAVARNVSDALGLISVSPFYYEGALDDGNFGQRLDYFCRTQAAQEPSASTKLEELLGQFDENFPTVTDILRYVPDDTYLSNYVNWANRSNLGLPRKQSIYRNAYNKCVAEPEWNKTLRRILSQTDILTINEVTEHLNSKDKYVRLAAEGAMKRLQARDDPDHGEQASGDSRQMPPPDEHTAPTGDDEEHSFTTEVFQCLVTSSLLLIASGIWWRIHRRTPHRRGK